MCYCSNTLFCLIVVVVNSINTIIFRVGLLAVLYGLDFPEDGDKHRLIDTSILLYLLLQSCFGVTFTGCLSQYSHNTAIIVTIVKHSMLICDFFSVLMRRDGRFTTVWSYYCSVVFGGNCGYHGKFSHVLPLLMLLMFYLYALFYNAREVFLLVRAGGVWLAAG